MKRFEKIIRHTLKWEGGYVNDPDDAGGETNFGITKRQYPNIDIKNLTIEGAIEIYRQDYYKSYMNDIKSFKIASRLYDLSVNMGHKRPNKMLQEAAKAVNGSNMTVDGAIGPVSIKVINACDEDKLYDEFYELAKARYERIAKRGNNKKFLKGWMNRLNDPIIDSEEESASTPEVDYIKSVEEVKGYKITTRDDIQLLIFGDNPNFIKLFENSKKILKEYL